MPKNSFDMAERAALRSMSVSKQRYKMFLDASASFSPSKSPMHYAHTDGGVSAIRCLDQSVDEPPDSPAPPPARPQRRFPDLWLRALRNSRLVCPRCSHRPK